MGNIRLVITDLDGTFLDNGTDSNKSNVEALAECKKAGIPVCAITARAYTTALRVMRLAGFEGYCVACNGASMYDMRTDEALFQKTMPKEWVGNVLTLCHQTQSSVFVAAKGGIITCEQLGRRQNGSDFDVMNWPANHRPLRVRVETIEQMLDWIGDDAELMNLHAKDDDAGFDGSFYRAVMGAGEFSLTGSHPGGLDIMANGVCKTVGAQMLACRYAVQPEQVMACGDHNNDIGMLRWAGIGVAVGDAQPGAKAAANYISADHDKGGVAEAIYRFVL